MSNTISGYYGIFKAPLALNPKYGNTIYCITNDSKSTLICLVLSPDASYDLYNLCRTVSYTNIYIIPVSMDILFQSSICNTILNLSKVKPKLKWVYPTKITSSVIELDSRQIMESEYSFVELNNSKIIFARSNQNDLEREYYDITVFDGAKTCYFSTYTDSAKALTLFNNELVDEIHVPYDSTIYGGLTYLDIKDINLSYRNKFVIHSFLNEMDYNNCISNTSLHTGEVKYSYFV